jgi:NADH dehydrogenase
MTQPRIVIVGAGFAGYHAAKEMCRIGRGRAEIVLVSPHDYFLYLPLLPEVAAGLLDPRDTTVSLAGTLPGVRLVLAEATGIDLAGRRIKYTDAEGREGAIDYHRLVLALGSVNKLLPVPGVAEHAHGFRGIPEALYLRDHLTRQMALADATDDPMERLERTTFVVVGAGYTGTEVAAHASIYTDILHPDRHRRSRASGAGPTAVRHGPQGAGLAPDRGTDRHVGQGGHGVRGHALRRPCAADTVADLVCGGTTGSAHRGAGA